IESDKPRSVATCLALVFWRISRSSSCDCIGEKCGSPRGLASQIGLTKLVSALVFSLFKTGAHPYNKAMLAANKREDCGAVLSEGTASEHSSELHTPPASPSSVAANRAPGNSQTQDAEPSVAAFAASQRGE